MRTSRWPISHLPISDITPFTYRDGETYLELLNRLSQYITEQLHPNLRKTVEHMVEEMEHILAAQHNKYVEGIQDFQRIHDAFMTDVNSALMALNDNAVADLARDPGSVFGSYLQSTLNAIGHTVSSSPTTYSHRAFNISGGDAQQLQDAVSDMSGGDVLTIPDDMVFTTGFPITVDKPVTIRGGQYQSSTAFDVTSGGVTLERVTIDGISDCMVSGTRGIRVRGSATQYLDGFTLRDSVIRNVSYDGVRTQFVRDVAIERNVIHDFRYAAIALSSVDGGIVTHNTIRDGISDMSVNHNCYGVSTSVGPSVSLAHRPRNIEVSHNTVSNIPHWEGLDTHNGQNIRFLNNTVRGCRRGIALVASSSEPDSGPTDCKAIGNTVDGDGASHGVFTEVIGITMAGNADGVRKSDAIITNNTVINVNGSNDTPILFRDNRPNRYTFEKCVVTGNSTDSGRLPSTVDSGWVDAETHFEFPSNGMVNRDPDRPILSRLQVLDGKPTLMLQGSMYLSTEKSVLRVNIETRNRYPELTPPGVFYCGGIVMGDYSSSGQLFLSSECRIIYGGMGSLSGSNSHVYVQATI